MALAPLAPTGLLDTVATVTPTEPVVVAVVPPLRVDADGEVLLVDDFRPMSLGSTFIFMLMVHLGYFLVMRRRRRRQGKSLDERRWEAKKH